MASEDTKSHNAMGSPTALKRHKFGESIFKGVISCRPPGLEVAGRSSAWVSCIPKEHKLVLARKGQVIRGPDTLLFQAQLDPGDLTISLIRGSKRLGFSPRGHSFQKTSLHDGPASSAWQP